MSLIKVCSNSWLIYPFTLLVYDLPRLEPCYFNCVDLTWCHMHSRHSNAGSVNMYMYICICVCFLYRDKKKVITSINIKTKLWEKLRITSQLYWQNIRITCTHFEKHTGHKGTCASRRGRCRDRCQASHSGEPSSPQCLCPDCYHTGHLHRQQQSSKENHLCCELKGRFGER